jgi:hypothetical protein
MGRRNERGLDLSFKPLKGSRGRGRWYKKIQGQSIYFGWGIGVTDRKGYQAALNAYHAWMTAKESDRTQALATALTRRLQADLSVLDQEADQLELAPVRGHIDELRRLGRTLVADFFASLADGEEKRRLLALLENRSLDDIRRAAAPEPAPPKSQTTADLLDTFLAVQRQRMERRQKLDKLREAGQMIKEAGKQNISEGRFAAIARDVTAMKKSVGIEPWDGTEATAARIVRKFRETSDALVLDDTHSPHTFNDRIKLARMFCAWAEATYQLDRLPRDRTLFAKYATNESKAKAIPLNVLRKLWAASDDRGRC